VNVPFLDLKAQYLSLKDELDAAIRAVLEKTAFAGGPFVAQFEEEYAAYCGRKHCVGVGSGTDALWFALLALGVGPGDEVITAVNTFIATAEAISFCGAKPVFVDVDPKTCNMDPAKLAQAFTDKTAAVIPVHLFGQMADLDAIAAITRERGVPLIEDASQAHGAEYRGQGPGTIGAAACFSFYPGKNLGAYGEAGGIVTDDDELAAGARMLRDHGQGRKYYHEAVGWNGRMDGIQGAVLSVKLKQLDAITDARRRHADTYRSLLGDADGISLPHEAEYAKHVYHVYAVRVANRDAVMDALKEKGVGCGIHYPVPLHLQKAYAELGHNKGDFPVAEQSASEFLSLPMFPELTDEQIQYVADTLRQVIA